MRWISTTIRRLPLRAHLFPLTLESYVNVTDAMVLSKGKNAERTRFFLKVGTARSDVPPTSKLPKRDVRDVNKRHSTNASNAS